MTYNEIVAVKEAIDLLHEEAMDETRCAVEVGPGSYVHTLSRPCKEKVKAAREILAAALREMKPGWIQTFTGKAMYPLEPRVEDIDIQDIAHALSHLCRFTGHCKYFYAVSEHSWRVSKYLESIGESREIQLWGLLHDASEAYLQDIPRPLKILPEFAFYREAEKRLQNVICEKFRLPLEQPEAVKSADMSVLAAEKINLMAQEPASWGDLPEPAHWITGTNMLTKWDFLELFEKLTVTG